MPPNPNHAAARDMILALLATVLVLTARPATSAAARKPTPLGDNSARRSRAMARNDQNRVSPAFNLYRKLQIGRLPGIRGGR